ncbi:MAG: hypothetical protein ACI4T2_03035 [Christensenellales bacterium]
MLDNISPCELTTLATLVAQNIASCSSVEEINVWRMFFSQIASVLATFCAQEGNLKKGKH